MARITIGITTYNGAERVANLLQSILLRTPQGLDWCVVLVDDGSPNKQPLHDVWNLYRGRLPKGPGRTSWILNHRDNQGISAGWNTATCGPANSSEYVVLINDDVIVSLGWLETLVFALDNNPGVGVVGANWHAFLPEDVPELLRDIASDENVDPREPVSKARTPSRRTLIHNPPGRVMAPTGQLFAFRRADYEAVGGFDETYRSFYEEIDFGTAMAKHGKIGLQLNNPFNWHQWSATFGSSPELKASERMAASHEHYCRKWAVPEAFHQDPFGFTNPKYLGVIGDVPVKYLKPDGSVGEVVLAAPR